MSDQTEALIGDPSRRQLLRAGLAGCGLCLLSGCGSSTGAPAGEMPVFEPGPVDAGPVAGYDRDGVFDACGRRGFFVVRRGGRLFAVSSVCTHQAVLLNAGRNDLGCPRHGSVFSVDGLVLKAPARRSLPHHALRVDHLDHLIVDTSIDVPESDWQRDYAFIRVPAG